MAGYLAYIIPVDRDRPVDPGYGVEGPPPKPSHPIYIPGAPPGSPGSPTHPIYIEGIGPSHPIYVPGLPPGHPAHPIYGGPVYPSQGPGFPTNPIAPGGQPPYPSQGPGFPTNPIAPGGEPPGYWGGVAPPVVDNGLPVPPTVWPPEPIAPLPPDLSSQIVVAVHRPGQDWEVKTYPVGPDQSLPPHVDPRGR